MRTTDALRMPSVFDTFDVYRAWLAVLRAQYQGGYLSPGRYRARCQQARKQWDLECRRVPERLRPDFRQGDQTA